MPSSRFEVIQSLKTLDFNNNNDQILLHTSTNKTTFVYNSSQQIFGPLSVHPPVRPSIRSLVRSFVDPFFLSFFLSFHPYFIHAKYLPKIFL